MRRCFAMCQSRGTALTRPAASGRRHAAPASAPCPGRAGSSACGRQVKNMAGRVQNRATCVRACVHGVEEKGTSCQEWCFISIQFRFIPLDMHQRHTHAAVHYPTSQSSSNSDPATSAPYRGGLCGNEGEARGDVTSRACIGPSRPTPPHATARAPRVCCVCGHSP